jgi:phospholipase C
VNHVESSSVDTVFSEGSVNRPGMSGDSTSWEGWSHVRWFVEEVSAGAA